VTKVDRVALGIGVSIGAIILTFALDLALGFATGRYPIDPDKCTTERSGPCAFAVEQRERAASEAKAEANKIKTAAALPCEQLRAQADNAEQWAANLSAAHSMATRTTQIDTADYVQRKQVEAADALAEWVRKCK
jgi:hypothetical protein